MLPPLYPEHLPFKTVIAETVFLTTTGHVAQEAKDDNADEEDDLLVHHHSPLLFTLCDPCHLALCVHLVVRIVLRPISESAYKYR